MLLGNDMTIPAAQSKTIDASSMAIATVNCTHRTDRSGLSRVFGPAADPTNLKSARELRLGN